MLDSTTHFSLVILQKRMNYTRFVGYLSDYCGLVYMLHMMWLKLESSQSFIWHYIKVYNVIFKNKRERYWNYFSIIIHKSIIDQLPLSVWVFCTNYKAYIKVIFCSGINCTVIRIKCTDLFYVCDLLYGTELC